MISSKATQYVVGQCDDRCISIHR